MSNGTHLDDASEPFVALPGFRDIALLESAFSGAECAYRWARAHPWIKPSDTSNAPELLRAKGLAASLGEKVAVAVVEYYVNKARDDVSQGVVVDEDYKPWADIGLPIPFGWVEIESGHDGADWMRIGDVGPIPFGFVGAVPDRVVTMCLQRTEDREGFQVVFVGHRIDPADSGLL